MTCGKITHRDVDCTETRTVEGRSHFKLAIHSLLPEDRYLWSTPRQYCLDSRVLTEIKR